MGVFDTLKDVANFAKDVKNIPLYEQLVSLQNEVVELYNENRDLKEEVRQLREQIELRDKLSFDQNFYWIIDGDSKEGPFCPQCYDKENKIRRMLEFGHLRACPTCELLLHQDGRDPSSPERNRLVKVLGKKPS